jgi:hypothetical protein
MLKLEEPPKFLNRFTTLPFLFDLLVNESLVFLNPDTWEDYNDRVSINAYKEKINVNSIYALCLSRKRETIHHWNAFAAGTSGCCIEFDFGKMIKKIEDFQGLAHGQVQYKTLKALSNLSNEKDKLPFMKRQAFKPEQEYRFIVTSLEEQKPFTAIPIDIDCINRVTVTCKVPKGVFISIKETILCIKPNFNGKIIHSTLLKNTKWAKFFTIDERAPLHTR